MEELLNSLKQAFEDFKKANDERLKQVEAKGHADPLLEEQVNKANATISDIQAKINKRMDDFEARLNRSELGGGSEQNAALAAHRTGFNVFVRRNNVANLAELEINAGLTTQSDPDGGFFVPTEVESAITRILGKMSVMRQLATIRTVGAQEYKKYVSMGGAKSGWVGEEDTRADTGTPGLKELIFPTGTIYAFPFTTQDLLDDAAYDVEGWLSDEVGIELSEQEGAAFISGNGVKKPRGILAYDTVANASYAWGKLGYIASGASGAFAASSPADKIIDLIHALKAGYRQSAEFLTNSLTVAAIRKLKDGQGNYLWQPSAQAGQPSLLMGYAVREDDNMPDVAANSLSIAFGDFKRGYVITDRLGIRVLRDALTVKGKVGFYTTKRVGGGVQNFEAIKLMKFAAS